MVHPLLYNYHIPYTEYKLDLNYNPNKINNKSRNPLYIPPIFHFSKIQTTHEINIYKLKAKSKKLPF